MATTANGLPYPVGTDKVVDGDDAIRALAEAIDAKVLATSSIYWALISGVTDTNGIINYVHGKPWTPKWAQLTIDYGATGSSLAIIVSAGVQYIDPTLIAIRFRREDSHAWFPSQPVVAYLTYGR